MYIIDPDKKTLSLRRDPEKPKELPSWLIDRLKYAILTHDQLRAIIADWREGIDISDQLAKL